MRIYDISQEVFGCYVDPDVPAPQKIVNKRIAEGAEYNQTSLRMCAHNGTHVDAPFHFIDSGITVDQIPMDKLVGACRVAHWEGWITAADATALMVNCPGKLLIKGTPLIMPEAAEVFATLDLLGMENQSVDPPDSPMTVHKTLLAAETVLLEGLRLAIVPEGTYLLCAAPLCLAGSDGAPCRAVLIDDKD